MSEKNGFLDLMTQIDSFIFHPLTLGLCGFAVFCAILVFVMNTIKTGKSNPLRFSETPWLNAIYWFAIFFAPILALIFVSILAMLAQVGFRILSGDTMQGEADNLRWYVLAFVGLLTALGGIIGTPLALIRVHTTERQTKTAEQGHITDRINKAVEGLGAEKMLKRQRKNLEGQLLYEDQPRKKETKKKIDLKKPIMEEVTAPNLEVRIGAIFSLERIAKDSLRDHVQIMEILCTYVRQNSPAIAAINIARPKLSNFQENSMKAIIPNLRTDIATALTVIGRRTPAQKKIETLHPRGLFSLHGCNLQRLEGRDLDFSGIDFSGSWISLSLLYDCDFTGCRFENSTLDGGAMIRCKLDEIYAPQAVFKGRILHGSTFRGSYLFSTTFDDCRIDKNPSYGNPTDFSYSNIVNANFGNVSGYDGINKTPKVFSNEQLKIEDNAELNETGQFEMLTKEHWIKWKKSLGYTS